ncbi:MAG TPA: chemotaxis response regulator protein-glutamate methylesterase [Candidatus Acidoferrales bacterium]|jgi:two-component system chemotaxis response regulator CheB|nr:chemotaxis response regulator protein-glutamate methylesterase [Candidatus Acidoferrales bacterium]
MMNASEKKIRVLVVDDSAFMCKVLQEIINSDPQLEVVGQGRDGRDGVALADSLRPDVITMDINMPHVDGLQATELIMSQHPRPIVIVSSESREGAASTLKALELGAIDFVPKPSSGIDLDMKAVRDELTRKLKLAAKVRVVRTATRSKLPMPHAPLSAAAKIANSAALAQTNGKFPMVAIAASTGGPAAVTRVVSGLPKDFAAAVFLVLHMPAAFTKQFTVQLGEVASLPVKEAEAGETPQPGVIYLCPGSHHLQLSSNGKILLDPGPRIDGYRPCADVALETISAYARSLVVAVVLTGMGADAAKGVKTVKAAGGAVLAQDEATSTIFGMPAEAIKTGAVDEVLALDDIAGAIEKRVAKLARLVPAGAR